MKKISTLFKKDPNNLGRVINEINPENEWVIKGEGILTRKFDGTATAIINGELYKRYDAKLKKSNIFEIGDIVSKTSGKPFKNGELADEVLRFEINENHPNKEKGAFLKNSQTIVSLKQLQAVGRFTKDYQKSIPFGAIPCQEPDLITGHHPHWIKCGRNKEEDRYFFEGFDKLKEYYLNFSDNKNITQIDGTYELIGEKVQGNPEQIKGHLLVKHGVEILPDLLVPITFDNLKKYLEKADIEGIVFHHKLDGRMCKIRKSDFGIVRL